MKITKQLPVAGTRRNRKVFALLPKFFNHGSINEPKRTMIWLDYYIIEEHYQYGAWNYHRKRLQDETL